MPTNKVTPCNNMMCIECGKKIHSDDEYEWSRRSRAMGGGMIYIHTECYRKTLNPQNANNEILR